MNLTYEEYLNLIPEKTKQIVKKILQYIYYFEEQKQDLKITGREAIKRPKEIGITAAAYLGACSDSEINSKLKNKGFDSDRIHVSYNMSEISFEKEKEIFERHNNLFLNFKDESKYITQNPFNILRKALLLVTNSYEFESQLIALGLNDTVTRYVKEVDNNFHARYMVKSKTYEYKINMGEYNPLFRNSIFQYGKELSIEKIKLAIKYFIGTHDFTTFTCTEDKRTNKIRTIYDVSLSMHGDVITITFKGNGFLKYQIRNMVGTLIKVGEDKIEPEIIDELLNKKDRRCAFLCAPPEGLTLINVNYE